MKFRHPKTIEETFDAIADERLAGEHGTVVVTQGVFIDIATRVLKLEQALADLRELALASKQREGVMTEQTQTLTDRRLEDRRGKGREVSMFEAQWLMVNTDRRQAERRA